ncbi:MAG: glycosyltransferase family 2 protein [Candidatus Sumerlaeota bacterium]|nr:glycosyltransferase family 2 protein [Candidatus Sumerlaeota bacterium]
MTQCKPSISVVIPVYNEGKAAAEVCRRTREVLAALPPAADGGEASEGGVAPAFEIIIVDDGSTDGALSECPTGADLLVRHGRNRGYGAALQTGFRKARGKTIVIIDADGTYDPADVPKLLAKLSPDVEMAVGARTGAQVAIPLFRRPAKWLLNRLANYLAEIKIPDLNSGLRAVHKEALEDYLHLMPQGFSLTTTVTLAFLCDGREVAYVPINYGSRKEGKSKIRPLRDTKQILLIILRTITFFKPMKIFFPFSLILAIMALVVLLVSGLFLGRIMDGTVAVFTISSAQSFFFGLLADFVGRTAKARARRRLQEERGD